MTLMCHKGSTICVEGGSIQNHLSKGDVLGACPVNSIANNKVTTDAIQESNNALNVHPNPFSSSATISFFIPQTEKVSIEIYDLTGRLIKILTNEKMQAGTHHLTWNARDEKGNAVGSGIYLLKLQAGNYTETKKISVLK
jgi:flagellar hook assembly protein FlgD